jgi:uncharacterized SAM-binding protein YcdF (DUF218 family)
MAFGLASMGEPSVSAATGDRFENSRLGSAHRRLPRLVLRAVAGTAFVGLALFLAGFLIFVETIARYERRPPQRTDGIVVLTGGTERIGDGIDLLAAGFARRLLISGVNERTSRDEIARLNPGQRRLFDCCVDLDYRARNTIGNAIEARRWLHDHAFRSVILVTSAYHMPRALVEFDHALPEARKVPYPVVQPESWWRSPGTAKLLMSEYAKFLVGFVRTRFEDDPERSRAAVLMSRGKPVKMVERPADSAPR